MLALASIILAFCSAGVSPPLLEYPWGVARTPGGASAAVSLIGANEIILMSIPDMKEERRVGSEFLKSPRGLAFLDDDRLAIADYHNSRIAVVSLSSGSLILSFGRPEANATVQANPGWESNGILPEGQLRWPTDVAISPTTGNFFVADTWNHRVQEFDRNGVFLRSLGLGEGSGVGHFKHPRGIAISPAGDTLLICDLGNHRISLWRQDGKLLGQFDGEGQFRSPTAVTYLDDRRLVVSDFENDRLQLLALDSAQEGETCSAIGTSCKERSDLSSFKILSTFGESGNGEGQLSSPAGIAAIGANAVFVADFDNHRVVAHWFDRH